ncbi:ABC transporter substrate-binding protein [Desertimonas flava]|uniref:ABC transporter substrate-binding protein n=1 Tax=Desertimonas flava TaxID=2064846 RepID=UPI000E353DBC|nr:ABC transporter substrate-binding protein [Desertimonas flava]
MNRSPLLAASLVAMSTVTASTPVGATTPEASDLTVMLNWSPNAHHLGIYVAEQRGWYDEAGLDVTIVEPGADGVATALASGQIDVGITVAEGLLPARAAGIPIVSIATILPHNDSSLIALAESGIERPRDLEGKRYGGYGGPLEVELISRLVECDGGDPDEVQFVEIGDVDYLAGMDQGAFDVAWVFSGWDGLRASVIEDREIVELRLADHIDCIPDWYTPLFAASEATIADEPELLAAFLDTSRLGYAAAAEDPAAAADDLLAAAPEVDAALVHAAAEYYASRFTDGDVPWGNQDHEVWAEFAAFATDAGLLEDEVDVTAAYTNDLLG